MSVGTALPHDAAGLHVTGQARYIDDLPSPAGTLHLAFGLSTIAHGTITGLDLAGVRAASGVVLVLTAADLPFANDVSPSAHDEPLLATGEVHFVGQPVFVVVANSHLAARKAAKLARTRRSNSEVFRPTSKFFEISSSTTRGKPGPAATWLNDPALNPCE